MYLEEAIAYVGGNYGPSPGQLANIIFRCILHLGAIVACWVPVQLFYRSGELAGMAMVLSCGVLNFYYFVNTLIWHNDDIANWSRGFGWCDVQLATVVPLETLIAASTCAILRNVAHQVSLSRATRLTGNEIRRKMIMQALIIFPVPLLQGILYYFVIAMRYNISGVLGCQAVFHTSWVFLVFFLLPVPMFSLFAGHHAVVTWWRYRLIDAASRKDLWSSGNSIAQARNGRTRRKLYFMTLTIIVPYLPMQLIFLYNNVSMGMPWSQTYDLSFMHRPGWQAIDYAPSTMVPWAIMYGTYISVIEVVIIFLHFGLTKDAHDIYRSYLRALGLGKLFPKLNEEWFPSDQPPTSLSSLWSRAKRVSTFTSPTQTSQSSNQSGKSTASACKPNDIDDMELLNIHLDSFDLESAHSTTDAARFEGQKPQLPNHGPWVFGAILSTRFQMRTVFGRNRRGEARKPPSQRSLEPVIQPPHAAQAPSHPSGQCQPGRSSGHVNTRVWASEAHGSPAVEGVSFGDGKVDDGVVRIERHISSCSEVSPPKPAYRQDW